MRAKDLEKLAKHIATLGHADLIKLLKGMNCCFELDFTDEFLHSVSLERLRHIVLAASLHARSSCEDLREVFSSGAKGRS